VSLSFLGVNFSLSAPLTVKHPNPKILFPFEATANQKTLTFFVPYLQRFAPIQNINEKTMINFIKIITAYFPNRHVKQRPKKQNIPRAV